MIVLFSCHRLLFLLVLFLTLSGYEEKEITDEKKFGSPTHTAKLLNLTSSTTEPPIIWLNGLTLEEGMDVVCKLDEIPPENCTCDFLHNEYGYDGFCESFSQSLVSYLEICLKSTLELVEAISITLISTIGIFGNILVLVVRVRNWKLSLHYQLISGLAMADLAFSCVFLIISIPQIWLCDWKFGEAMCSLLKTTLSLSSNIDLGFILIIAIERNIGIVHPFTGGVSACKVYGMILLNVIIGFLAALPLFFVNKIRINGSCGEDWSMFPPKSSLIYGWVSNIFFFVIPMVITAILYFQSIRALKSTLFRQEMLAKLDEASRKKLLNENKRILRVILTILIAFFFLLGPNHVAWFLSDNFAIPNEVIRILFTVSSIAYALHTAVNPIIYSIIDRKFRRNIYYLVRHGKRRKSYSTIVTAVQSTPVHQMSNSSSTDQNPPPTMRDSRVEYYDNIC